APPLPRSTAAGDQAWQWGGCGDDVTFEYLKSRQFMDLKRKRGASDICTLIDLHNSEAGRLTVKNFLLTECKCHGLSGSCSVRTCWKKTPALREVGGSLLARFQSAVRVTGSNDGKNLIPAVPGLCQHPGRYQLLFSAESPHFCLANRRTGAQGTHGRACSETKEAGESDLGSCEALCCGRGFREETVRLEENCQCRFYWCCVVQCKMYASRRNVSVCL
ncbi:protein Wnt-6-like, partial [Acipenser ruthenus]|uniref:protein Wnt-6-like n=1 Tax=Acipenser ruthenus TaxID=7906 RepID=UPI002741FC7A